MYRITIPVFLIFLVFAFSVANAKPYVPENDDFVLLDLSSEKLSENKVSIQKIKQRLKLEPRNHQLVYKLANAYLHEAKENADPRFYGLAEKLIDPWVKGDSHVEFMLMKARIHEFNHEFKQAINILNNLPEEKHHAQSNLMKANIYQVIGDYENAKANCRKLLFGVNDIVTIACLLSVEGFTASPEKIRQIITRLTQLLDRDSALSTDIRLWVLGLIAEVYSMNNYWEEAENAILAGLNLKANDTYLLSLYADLLLKQNRYEACFTLLKPYQSQTTLLVRFLTASERLSGMNTFSAQKQSLEMRMREDEIKADKRHLREYAYYQFYVRKDYQLAYENALTNWKKQKEMIDSLILYAAAAQLNKQPALDMLNSWIAKNHIQVDFSRQYLKN